LRGLATDTEKGRRTIKVAREAFDAIVRLRENAELTDAEESKSGWQPAAAERGTSEFW